MILTECKAGTAAEARALGEMFRARKRVFVDMLKWDVPVLGDFEIDGFDDEHAEYLILTDSDGRHLASARLLETVRPHILGSLFPFLCDGGVPAGPTVLEITRFCLDPRAGAATRRLARNRLVSALVTVALKRGISMYTGVAELGWLQQILAFGWKCRPLGLPRQLDCGLLGALAIDIDERTPDLLEARGIWAAETAGSPALAEAA